MNFSYPIVLTPDENGTIMVRFPDVPEAFTCGRTKSEALLMAQDALHVAFTAYMKDNQDIPKPSKSKKGQPTVLLSPLVIAKLEIYQTLKTQGVTEIELASRLHCDLRYIRRLLDLDHSTRLDHLEAALSELGKRIVLTVMDAA